MRVPALIGSANHMTMIVGIVITVTTETVTEIGIMVENVIVPDAVQGVLQGGNAERNNRKRLKPMSRQNASCLLGTSPQASMKDSY